MLGYVIDPIGIYQRATKLENVYLQDWEYRNQEKQAQYSAPLFPLSDY